MINLDRAMDCESVNKPGRLPQIEYDVFWKNCY